jgi:DNA-directed RNA polymerase specialized sigma24 family protein
VTTKTRLIQASLELKRKVFSSLPWGHRVAHLCHQVRFASDASVFGQSMYGLFLLYGVKGMPETSFMPKNTKDINRLHGYGRDFGKKAFGFALRLFKSDTMRVDKAGEVLSLVFMKLFSNPMLKETFEGKSLSYAENYTYSAIRSEAYNLMRKDKLRSHSDIEDMVHEPSTWGHFADLFPVEEQEEMLDAIERAVNLNIFPDIVEFFKLLMEGYNTEEIANKRLLPSLKKKPMTPNGLRKYENVIMKVLQGYFGVS